MHVYWRDYQWPDFNTADSAITIGVALLVIDILRSPEPQPQGAPGHRLGHARPGGPTTCTRGC